jgi:hypothetical protein
MAVNEIQESRICMVLHVLNEMVEQMMQPE